MVLDHRPEISMAVGFFLGKLGTAIGKPKSLSGFIWCAHKKEISLILAIFPSASTGFGCNHKLCIKSINKQWAQSRATVAKVFKNPFRTLSMLRHKKAYAGMFRATFIRFCSISRSCSRMKILPRSVRKVNDASSGARSSCLESH
jgi:hypothetical protein